jgi:hypothetical protein
MKTEEKEVTATKTVTESDRIWEEIQNLPIAMFALPGQVVQQHVKRFLASPDAVYLKLNSPAVIASLEVALADSRTNKKYAVEQADGGYIVVKRAVTPFVMPK